MRLDEITKNEFISQLKFTPAEQQEREDLAEVFCFTSNQPTLEKAILWMSEQKNGWKDLCDMFNDPRMFDNKGTRITKNMILNRLQELKVDEVYKNAWAKLKHRR